PGPYRGRHRGGGNRGRCLGLLGRGISRTENRGHEAIPSTGNRLNETGLLGIVLEDLADLADGAVDAVVNIEEGGLAPDPLGDLLPADQLSRLFSQEQENVQWDPLQLEQPTPAPELISRAIQLQLIAKANDRGEGCRFGRHGDP